MDTLEKIFRAVFDALPPDKQAIFGAIVLGFGVFVVSWTWISGKRPASSSDIVPSIAPSWSVLGPVHETMEAIHELVAQNRALIELHKTNGAVLRDIDKTISGIDRGQTHTHRLLENIERNQELGIHPALAPRPERRTRQQ